MAKQIWNNSINKHTDWGGDSSTNNLPVSGEKVQEFIKNLLDSKVGELYYDVENNRYLVFSDLENRDIYLNDPVSNSKLLLGTFDAPFNYTAEINLISNNYNAIPFNSTGNYIEFTFDVKNKSNQSTGDNVLCTYTIQKGSIKQIITEQYAAGRSVKFNLDKYIGEGTNNITITLQGQSTLATTSIMVIYLVVNLNLSDNLDITKIYDLSSGSKVLEVPFSISGYGTKIVEWYLDGIKLDYIKSEDEVVDVATTRTKYITLSNLSQGAHNLQFRAYTTVEGELFYSDILYRDIIIYTGENKNTIIATKATIPSNKDIITNGNLTLYNVVQYVPYTIEFATYSPSNLAEINVDVIVNDELKGTVISENNTLQKFTFTVKNADNVTIKLQTSDSLYLIGVETNPTTMNILEITNDLVLDFSAIGRNNSSTNKDVWSYGNYTGEFTGFNWNNNSGWVDNSLLVNNGAKFKIDYLPLSVNPTQKGKTFEIEFKSVNVIDDSAVLLDLTNDYGTGIKITASEVILTSADGKQIKDSYPSEEWNRFVFIINKSAGTTNKCLSFIYANGKVSRAIDWLETDNYTSPKFLEFIGSNNALIGIKYIKIYDTALSSDLILNNFNIYRDSIEEMNDIYNRNDVYEYGTTTFDPDKMSSRLPIMKFTGNIPELENTTDKNLQIKADIEYTNLQDPTRSFVWKNAAIRPLGTSSMGYPKKNFRIYSQKYTDTTCFDYQNNEVKDKLYSFKEGALPVNCFCLKADYAESSGTHNTGIARLWNEVMVNASLDNEYVLRTEAQKQAVKNNYEYDVRTTIDGFPILLFYRLTENDPYIFIGKYNFNNDKSTESVFGFKNIPGFDNRKMQCWEVLNNGNPLALFLTTENFDSSWEEAFECRYPEDNVPSVLPDLKAHCVWQSTVTQENFATEKWDHYDVYKVAAYYIYFNLFGAVDQLIKNSMITSEDGQHYYYINYDNDTINGLINSGPLRVPYNATRQTKDTDGTYFFAGHDAVNWNMFEADEEFMLIVEKLYESLYNAGLRFNNIIEVFDELQASKWVEKVYNQDAQYKYIQPYVESGVNNLFMLQGDRSTHRKYWLAKRIDYYDSIFVGGEYKSKSIELKCINETPAGLKFTITAGTSMNYGYGINNLPRESRIELNVGDTYTFTTQEMVNLGDPIRIYTAPNISGLDLSEMGERLAVLTINNVYDDLLGSKLKTLILGKVGMENNSLESISGLQNANRLEVLEVSGMKKILSLDLSNQKQLKTLRTKGSGVNSIILAQACPISELELSDNITTINFNQLPQLTYNNIQSDNNLANVYSINIINTPGVSNSWGFIWNWYQNKTKSDDVCNININQVNWQNVQTANLITLILNLQNRITLKGKIHLSSVTLEQINTLKSLLGNTIFNKDAELYIYGPDAIFIQTPKTSINEGLTLQFSNILFSDKEGTVKYSIYSGSRTGASINENTGLLTTTDNGLADSNLTIRATYTSENGSTYSDINIVVKKLIYPSSVEISGLEVITSATQQYTLNILTPNVNGQPLVSWELTGDAANYANIDYSNNKTCTIRKNNDTIITDGVLKVTLRRPSNNKVLLIQEKTIRLLPNAISVIFDSNQEDKSDIEGLKATITYNGNTIEASSGEVIVMPLNTVVNISYPSVLNYKKPEDITFTFSSGYVEKIALYQTELVTVKLSTNNNTIPTGTSININNVQYTYDGTKDVTAKIPYDTEYDVIVTPSIDYLENILTYSFVANSPVRTINCLQFEVAIRPTSAVISGESDLWFASSRDYILTISPSEVNTTYSVAWSLSGNASPYLSITNATNNSCKVKVTDRANCTGDLTLMATITTDNGTEVIAAKSIKVDTQIELYTKSNQTADNNDTWKKQHTITLKYGSKTITAKHGDILPIPITSYTISYSDFEGYKKPDNISDSIKSGAGASITGTYKTEVVSVNITAEEGVTLPSSVPITINGKEYTWSGSAVTAKVPFSVTYDVVFGNVEETQKPETQTFTANSVSRSVSGKYKKIYLGIYLYDQNNDILYKPENLPTNVMPLYIYIGTEDHKFYVSKDRIDTSADGVNKTFYITPTPGEKTTSLQLAGVSSSTTTFDGKENTEKMLQVYGTDAEYAASALNKVNGTGTLAGKKAYLLSAAEMNIIMKNYDEFKAAAEKINTTIPFGQYYWTSTINPSKNNIMFRVLFSSGNSLSKGYTNAANRVLLCFPFD